MFLVNLRNGFKCLLVNSSFLAGHLPVFRISCLSKSLCFLRRVQLLSLCSGVWSSILQGQVALSVSLNLWRCDLVLPCPVTSAVKFGVIFILRWILSWTFRKNCFVTAAILHHPILLAVYVCVCVCVFAYMYVYLYICMYLYALMHVCVCVYTHCVSLLTSPNTHSIVVDLIADRWNNSLCGV